MKLNLIDPPYGTKFLSTDAQTVKRLWDKMKNFDPLFSDDNRWDYEKFCQHLFAQTTVILEIERGILFLTGLRPGHYAQIHACFWDHRMSPRIPLLKECLIWAFTVFNLVRLEALIPKQSYALRRILQRKLNFQLEGVMRKRLRRHGVFCDLIIYSILREETEAYG